MIAQSLLLVAAVRGHHRRKRRGWGYRPCDRDRRAWRPTVIKTLAAAREAFRLDPPIAHRVGIGQGVASDGAAETQMIELGGLRAQTSFDVAQAFAPGQLRKRQTQILIKAGESLDLVLATIARDGPTKCRQRQMRHDLGKT